MSLCLNLLPPYSKAIFDAMSDPSRKRLRRIAERELANLGDERAVPLLIGALKSADSQSAYRVLSALLAARPHPETVAELARQAAENKRFPRLPIRALGKCPHPDAVDALVLLLDSPRTKQRKTALDALGEQKSVRAVEPLARLAAKPNDDRSADALRHLHRMGRPTKLALRLLQASDLAETACARALVAMEILPIYVFPLSFTTFDAERFLVRVSGRGESWRARVQSVLKHVREEQTLLRPAASVEGDVLLRPTTGSGRDNADDLLRASGPSAAQSLPEKRAWWRKLIRR